MADPHNRPKMSQADIVKLLGALPARLEIGADILADMTPDDLRKPLTDQAVAMMAEEMRGAAALLVAFREVLEITPPDAHNAESVKPGDACLDCDGLKVYPNGEPCKSCSGAGLVLPGDGEPIPPKEKQQ